MNVEQGLALLVLLYALYGLVKVQSSFRRSGEVRWLIVLSMVVVLGLDAGFVLLNGSGDSVFWRLHYIVALVPLLAYVVASHWEGVRSKEREEQVMIRNAFQPYVSQELVEQVVQKRHELKLGGEKRLLSVWYSNLEGFRRLAEKMSTEEVVHFLNVYLSEVSNVILQQGGVLDKYNGEGVWSFWGAPLLIEESALVSCRAALDMQKRLRDLRGSWEKKGFPKLKPQVGLILGKVIVGNLGSMMRFDYSLFGFQARLAKVLCNLNHKYGTKILVSDSVYEKSKDAFVFREVEWLAIGKRRPIRIFELLGDVSQRSKYELFLGVYNRALALYRKREWLKAKALFEEVLKMRKGERVCQVYLDRIKEFIHASPPKDWEGVERL